MWGKTKEAENSQQPDSLSPESRGFVEEINAAAGGSDAVNVQAEGPEAQQQPEAAEPRAFFFSKLISQKVAPGLIRFPFSKLAASDHPAWMPSDLVIGEAVPAVQGGLEEVLDLIVPELLDRYAGRFPRISEACGTLIGLWFTQWTLVRKMKAVEAMEAAAKEAEGRTVSIRPEPATVAGL